jgi:hypothetical protein
MLPRISPRESLRDFLMLMSATLFCAQGMADPVKLPAGMGVELELQHHVNSSYIPAGAPIYFRVAKDVVINGQVLIRAGTLVTGKMDEAQDRGMVGKSGSMKLGVHTVTAVDGTEIPIDADLSKQGRSRAGATVAWILFWGPAGLVTHGVNPYLERGTSITGSVISEMSVDPSKSAAQTDAAAGAPAAAVIPITIVKEKFASGSSPFKFNIEKDKDLKTVSFDVQVPAQLADPESSLKSLELVAIDGVPVPAAVRVKSATSKSVTFDGWSVVQYCRSGVTDLKFRGVSPSGQVVEGDYQLKLIVIKKG